MSEVPWTRVDKDDDFIRAALAEADLMVLRVLLHQYGDPSFDQIQLGEGPGEARGMAMPAINRPEDQQLVRERIFEHLRRNRDEGVPMPAPPTDRKGLKNLIELAMSTTLPDDELDFWIEESGLKEMPREVDWGTIPVEAREQLKIVIIGAGFSGIYMAIQLKRAGIPFELIEKNPKVGGTWHENTYPGIRVDVESIVYSYSFEPYYPWKHAFAPRHELEEYIEYVVDKHGIRDHIRFNTEVTGATWDEDGHVWNIDLATAEGQTERTVANGIVTAVGLLNRPKMPDIAGIEDFKGTIMHTAKWDHSVELAGKKVASIGTGSSGLQLAPDLAPLVDHLTVFQRSAAWVQGTPNYRAALSEEAMWLRQGIPYYANWFRLRLAWTYSERSTMPAYDVAENWDGESVTISPFNKMVHDALMEYMRSKIGHRPDLMEKCTPNYPAMAKRLIRDNGWFDALLRDDVDLVTEPIDRITEKGILLKNGTELEFDIIVFASGFRASDYLYPMNIVGKGGLSLNEFWSKDGARAYYGMMMPHFPNLWAMYGPNTNPKSGNPILLVEVAARYVIGCIKALIDHDFASLDIREDVFDEYQAKLDAALANSIWYDKRQSSYYRNDKYGRVDVMTPWGVTTFWKWTGAPKLDEFVAEKAHPEVNDQPTMRLASLT